jgi:cobalamin biosynthesis Mg chelatase CobN
MADNNTTAASSAAKDKAQTTSDAAIASASAQIRKTASEANDKSEAPKRSRAELAADIQNTRDELAATLDAIETKLNLPKQARRAAHRAGNKLRVLRDENPAVLAIGIVGAAAAVAGIVWLGIRSLNDQR